MAYLNECTSCGNDFSSVKAFDRHRVGDFPQRGPSEYSGAVEDWTPEQGRRCLTADELRDLSLTQDENGRWQLPLSEKQRASLDRLKATDGMSGACATRTARS